MFIICHQSGRFLCERTSEMKNVRNLLDELHQRQLHKFGMIYTAIRRNNSLIEGTVSVEIFPSVNDERFVRTKSKNFSSLFLM